MGDKAKLVGRWSLASSVIAAACFVGSPASSATGAPDPHTFDARLSLTGDCTVSEADPVPDPGCPGPKHPPESFKSPSSVAVDSYGDIYVANYGSQTENGADGRIDVFNSSGDFITELLDPAGPRKIAVDGDGNLYVFQFQTRFGAKVERYGPSVYKPDLGEIAYANPPVVVVGELPGFNQGVAVNPTDDHVFVHMGGKVAEYSSAADGNEPLGTFGEGVIQTPSAYGLAVDAAHNRIYVSSKKTTPATDEFVAEVFALDASHEHLQTITGSSATADGRFVHEITIDVDEGTGHLFVYPEGNGPTENFVYELAQNGQLVSTIEHEFKYIDGAEIAIDNGANSPNGALNSPEGRYLFVPSRAGKAGEADHVFAFGPLPPIAPPVVESVSFAHLTESEATLQARINPKNLLTDYTFEYTTQADFEAHGFTGAQVAGEGEIPVGGAGVEVSAPAAGLAPGSAYRFRVIATNEEGSSKGEGTFATYPANPLPACPNDVLRIGLSVLLPDCRAYELVSPADTNARAPGGVGHLGTYFATREASPAGDRVSFITEGGVLPGAEGTGSLGGDLYLSTRGFGGWSTAPAGPSGAESVAFLPGSPSLDQTYSFWNTGGGEGSAAIGGKDTSYVRYPDGHSELVGRGSLGSDPYAGGLLIAEDGTHIIFGSAAHLEGGAPPLGTAAVYDRTADGVTHVVSLLPEEKTPKAGENAAYVGASLDGEGVAFKSGESLYLRYHDEKTLEVGKGVTFAGVAEGGARIFYLEAGNLKALDAASGKRLTFAATGNAVPINVAPHGTTAYFVSTSVIVAAGPNPPGAKAKPGQENLYRSREGTISFVGTVTQRDVVGEPGNEQIGGLGLWSEVVGPGRLGADPSRTTPEGNVLLFESRADLTGYDPEGHAEVYRYDFAADELSCLSCTATQAPATGEASLQSLTQGRSDPEPFSSYALVANLAADGRRAFFQSTEALVAHDTDGLQDVYEWEAPGIGSCSNPGGCLYLISSGHSERIDYLYAVSGSGDDVFFRTSDLLLGSDRDTTPSIYDARVGGGFPEPPAQEPCEGEGCHPQLTPPPSLPGPGRPAYGAHDNVARHCPKGRRNVKRHGKVRCIKKHRRHLHHKADTKKGAGR
jgi:hypothetical protein